MENPVIENNLSKKIIILAGIILLILAAAPSVYFYTKYQQAQKMLSSAPLSAKDEIKSLTEKVGKLIDLPKDEEPTVVTVTDINQVKDQPFFANAKNGDKVLVYANAKKAILYDPVANKVIEVGPLLVPSPSSARTETSPAATTMPTVNALEPGNIVLYNGTTTAGLTNTAENKLVSQLPSINVIYKEKAKKNDYTKTIVVDLTGKKAGLAEKVAQALDGEIDTLPAGEDIPVSSDSAQTIEILAILGQDFLKK